MFARGRPSADLPHVQAFGICGCASTQKGRRKAGLRAVDRGESADQRTETGTSVEVRMAWL